MATENDTTTVVENQRWTVKLEEDEDTGDLILPLPPEVLDILGLKLGDEMIWHDRGDGSWALEKNPK